MFQIEARVLGDLVINHIVPTAIDYQNILIKNVKGMREVMGDEADSMTENERELIRKISAHVKTIRSSVQEMIDARKKANKIEDEREKAYAYEQEVRPHFDTIRYHVDKLEMIVDNEMWPLPKYREMLLLLD